MKYASISFLLLLYFTSCGGSKSLQKLALAQSVATLKKGQCNGPFKISAQDQDSKDFPVDRDSHMPFTFESIDFSLDSACQQKVSGDLTILAGSSSVVFYVKPQFGGLRTSTIQWLYHATQIDRASIDSFTLELYVTQ